MNKQKNLSVNNILKDSVTLIFDTETTGLPSRDRKIRANPLTWPRLVEIGWVLCRSDGSYIEKCNLIIIPVGYEIPKPSIKIHGITMQEATTTGIPLNQAILLFCEAAKKADFYVAHNLSYDMRIIITELIRTGSRDILPILPGICTMRSSVRFCGIPGKFGKGFKWAGLSHLHTKLFGKNPLHQHRALNDAIICAECYHELIRRGVVMEIEDNVEYFFKSICADKKN